MPNFCMIYIGHLARFWVCLCGHPSGYQYSILIKSPLNHLLISDEIWMKFHSIPLNLIYIYIKRKKQLNQTFSHEIPVKTASDHWFYTP